MSVSSRTLERLVYVKLLYHQALEQAKAPVPLSDIAILMLHDAVETFLVIASAHLNAQIKNGQPFMDYWKSISEKTEKKPSGQPLGGKTAMEGFNKSRVNLKHYGIRPHPGDFQGFVRDVKVFFEDSTPLVFDLSFADISLLDLVPLSARGYLSEAQRIADRAQYSDAIIEAHKAYQCLMGEYAPRIFDHHASLDQALIYRYSGRHPLDDAFMDRLRAEQSEAINALALAAEARLQSIESVMVIQAINIDLSKHLKFMRLCPGSIRRALDGTFRVDMASSSIPNLLCADDAQFCIQHVIEVALALKPVVGIGEP